MIRFTIVQTARYLSCTEKLYVFLRVQLHFWMLPKRYILIQLNFMLHFSILIALNIFAFAILFYLLFRIASFREHVTNTDVSCARELANCSFGKIRYFHVLQKSWLWNQLSRWKAAMKRISVRANNCAVMA